MTYTGLCASSLDYYLLPGLRLEKKRKVLGTDVDKVVKVTGIDGVAKRGGEAEMIHFQVCRLTLPYHFQLGFESGRSKITFSARGCARRA